jgi:hypothetical protein
MVKGTEEGVNLNRRMDNVVRRQMSGHGGRELCSKFHGFGS